MSKVEQLITEHIDIWTSAILAKSTAGRGSNKKYELYGIKKLRELILDLAVRGKLVPQDPDDEPAAVLLEQIAAEKAQLIKDKKIKKDKLLKSISNEHEVFDLPQSWQWVNLQELITVMDAGWSPACSPEPSPSNDDWGVLKTTAVQTLHYKEHENKTLPNIREPKPQYEVKAGDILITRAGPKNRVGVSCLVESTRPRLMISDKIIRFHLVEVGVSERFISLCLNAGPTAEYLESAKSGMAESQMNISQDKLKVAPIPLCPLNEQYRIVAKVDELVLLCDQLEQQTETSIDAHAALVEVLLATLTDSADANELAQNWARVSEHFATLFTTEQSIEALKQTLLQLAVMGKLVPQDPNDEPATVLLEKIAAEKAQLIKDKKIKKEKPLPPIGDDEKPFELPQGWAWTRFGQLFRVTSGDGLSRNQMQDGDIPVFGGNGITGYHNDSNVDKPTVVIGRVGYYCGSVHLTPAKAWITDNAFFTIYDEDKLFQNFVVWLLKTINLQENTSATAQPVISGSKIYPILIPLPPFNEQYRIVAKINELMEICDQLKTNLQQSQETQVQLTDALIDQALG